MAGTHGYTCNAEAFIYNVGFNKFDSAIYKYIVYAKSPLRTKQSLHALINLPYKVKSLSYMIWHIIYIKGNRLSKIDNSGKNSNFDTIGFYFIILYYLVVTSVDKS